MAGVLIVGASGLLAGYWILVERSNAGLRQDVLAQAQQHAEQLADAVARQAEDLLHGIDNGLRCVRDAYRQDAQSFKASRRATLGACADGAIADIEVLDAWGEAVDGMAPANGLTGRGGRDHVLAQAASAADQLRVGPAIPGPVGEGWTIPASRKLMRDGRFDGVVVVFLRAGTLQQKLAHVARHPTDVVSLSTSEGAHVWRSTGLEDAPGSVPRIHGWHRLNDLPLVVDVGLDTRPILAPIEAGIELNRKAHVIGTVLIVLGVLLLVGLLLWLARQQRKAAGDEAALRITKAGFDAASEGIMVTDARNDILMVNAAFSRITGYSLQDVVGRPPSQLSSGAQHPQFHAAAWESLNRLGHWEGEVTNRHKSGELYVAWLEINVIDKDVPVRRRHVAVISDITARKRSEEMAWWRANYDELTELPNRRLLIDRLEHALVGAERHHHGVAVLFIDLDEFKPINDRFGHQAGDEVLKQVGSRMKLCTRKEDTVARLGGDEFVVMLATTRTEDDALRVAQKILKELHGPFQVGDKLLKIGASIGVAFSPRHGQTAEALLKKADAAMYAAKAAGRHTLRVHADDTAGSAGAGA